MSHSTENSEPSDASLNVRRPQGLIAERRDGVAKNMANTPTTMTAHLSDEQRAEVVTELAKAMIDGPTPPAGDTANGSNGEARNPSA
ncbi:hypothetical protein [Streptomyces sp. NPDC048527]|uniref:hypothetical protein n=1 Tax=Streptomyces sp. NPDC048527 TaxID=3365568 RepID=UPI0037202C6B